MSSQIEQKDLPSDLAALIGQLKIGVGRIAP